MPKEQFFHAGTQQLLGTLDEAARRGGVSRGRAFEDFLHMSVCALSGGAMEEEYLATVARYGEGKPGSRACDRFAQLFGQLVEIMEETRADILGDLFQGAITYGEAGQFLTPESVIRMMAAMLNDGEGAVARRTVCDPCCGSGRMLLAVADNHPRWEFIGQDIDLRCVRMTAINLALRNLYGYVLWGDSLRNERKLVYRTGFNLRGFVRLAEPTEVPPEARENIPTSSAEPEVRDANAPIPQLPANRQLRFF